VGRVEAAVEHRGKRKKIQRALQSDGPTDLRCVSGRVAERPEHAFHQHCQALVLALFRGRLEQVERHGRHPSLDAERVVNELGAVALKASPIADFVGDALRRLEDGVEVVLLH
jgi:hypothetical protein